MLDHNRDYGKVNDAMRSCPRRGRLDLWVVSLRVGVVWSRRVRLKLATKTAT